MRASGDFADRLAAPDAVRAKLERMLVAIYPEGTDLTEPLAALRADPGVLAAEMPTTGMSAFTSNRRRIG